MAVELYILDKLVELEGTENISTDYAIAEIGNFSTRKGFRSINFDLPITANNKAILENAELINNSTTRPYRRLKARVNVDGIDQNIRFCDIESSQDTYNVRLYGGNANLFDLLKALKVSDIDLSEFDHYINLTNIVNSRTNTVTDGYIYPLIDYHSDSPNVRIDDVSNVFRVNYTYPSVFEEAILNKAAAQLGYTLNNNLLNDLDYQQTEKILPCVTPIRNFQFDKYKQYVTKALTPPLNEVPFDLFANSPAGVFEVTVPQSNYYQVGGIAPFDFADAVEYTCEYDIQINNAGIASTISFFTFDTLEDGNSVFNLIFTDTCAVGANSWSGSYTRTALIGPTGSSSSQLFVFNTNANLTYTFASLEIVSGRVIQPGKIVFGSVNKEDYVTVSSLFGNVNAADIFKVYLQKYCSLITVDEDTKTVYINKFDDIANNIPNAINWSNKIDYTDNPLVEYALDEYAQSNTLTYKEESDITPPAGTNGVITVDDETLDVDSEFIESIYAATPMVVRLQGLLLPNIPLFETNDDSPPFTQQKGKANIKTLYLERISGNVDYTDGSTTTNVTTDIPLAWFIRQDKAYNLGFANNLIPLYYTTLQDVLNRTKVLTINVKLNAIDIYQLDFLKPVFIAEHNAYFYISKISGFTYGSSESTEVELVKLR
jgi:hypothetical protein